MVTVKNTTGFDVKVNGTEYIIPLLINLCGGFWLLKDRPDEYDTFIDKLPITDLTVFFSKDNSREAVIVDKCFDENAYDKVISAIKELPDKDLCLSSEHTLVCIDRTSMEISIV